MRKALLMILLATSLILALGVGAGLSQDNRQDTLDTPQAAAKLDKILAGQEEILSQLDQIKQELEVIKVRASR